MVSGYYNVLLYFYFYIKKHYTLLTLIVFPLVFVHWDDLYVFVYLLSLIARGVGSRKFMWSIYPYIYMSISIAKI